MFNPGGEREPARLQKWTSMANTNVTEVKPGVTRADGPNIHPTKAGYAKIASLIAKTCGT